MLRPQAISCGIAGRCGTRSVCRMGSWLFSCHAGSRRTWHRGMVCCWLRTRHVRSLHKGAALLCRLGLYRLSLVIRLSCAAGRLTGTARRILACRFSCRTGQNSPTAILHRRAAARVGFRLGMYGLFLLRILRDRAVRAGLHSSCVMIRCAWRCFSCRGCCMVLWRCHMTRRTSGARRHRCLSRGVGLFAICWRYCLRKSACHLFSGSLCSIRLCRSSLRGNSFLTGYGIRAALLRRRAAMIPVCIRGRIDIGSAASTASARPGRCTLLWVSAAAARLTTIFADGMRRIGHQRTHDHHRHCAREAAA